MSDIKLSVVIPAYNEEERLPKTLEAISSYLKKQSYSYEIIVVNDGSPDDTARVTKELQSKIEFLRLINNPENHGKGYVVRQGLLEAKGKYRLFTDADNSTSIDQVEEMWPEFEDGYDIVIGSRDVKGAVLDPPQPLFRRFVGDLFRWVSNIIVGTWDILDTQCGFKCFTAEAAEDVLPRCKIDRFAFDPEILLVAKKLDYKIKEIPVYWRNDLDSKVTFQSMFKTGLDLLKIRWNLITGKYKNHEL